MAYVALTHLRLTALPDHAPRISSGDVVATIAVSREQLDFGAWPVLGQAPAVFPQDQFPNEAFSASGYIGAKIDDAALAEDFLAAFHALIPWDDWHKPDYLDALLVSPDRKPGHLLYKGGSRP